MIDNTKPNDKTQDTKEHIKIKLNKDFGTVENALKLLKSLIDPISTKFTKKFNLLEDEKTHFIFVVEFFEPKNKQPVPLEKVRLYFRIHKKFAKDKYSKEITFNIENEAVNYKLFETLNMNYFESLLDRIMLNKKVSNKTMILATNFESTRIIDIVGQKIKYYTDDEAENILSNNDSEYFATDENFVYRETNLLFQDIHILWKALNPERTKIINYQQFERLFFYGKLNIKDEKIVNLWKYADKNKLNAISFVEFTHFSLDLLHCLRAYHIAVQKEKSNKYIQNKIKTCLDIMNQHFKEYDYEENQEISFENFKKCLEKENELFTRRDIEIICQKINPNNNFEYWKFDKILKILHQDHFNYTELCKTDKIYNYLINIFSKQDTHLDGKISYKNMRYALRIENKIKLNKTQILILLNFFTQNGEETIDYYKNSITLRNIIEELFCSNLALQKLEFANPKFNEYTNFEDLYDSYKKIQEIFIRFDEDFDHILNKTEFINFLKFLIPTINQKTCDDLFVLTDLNKDGVITFPEFKESFPNLIQMTRITNVLNDISKIKD